MVLIRTNTFGIALKSVPTGFDVGNENNRHYFGFPNCLRFKKIHLSGIKVKVV